MSRCANRGSYHPNLTVEAFRMATPPTKPVDLLRPNYAKAHAWNCPALFIEPKPCTCKAKP